jgi:hypothetical protein
MKQLVYIILLKLAISTMLLTISGCVEPNVSIDSVEINATKLRVIIAPSFNGYPSTNCVLLESSQLLGNKAIKQWYEGHNTVGSSNELMHTIADSSNSVYNKNVVSKRGVVGIYSYEYDLATIPFNKTKHYYALAMVNGGVFDCRCIDQYINEYIQ